MVLDLAVSIDILMIFMGIFGVYNHYRDYNWTESTPWQWKPVIARPDRIRVAVVFPHGPLST
jgi:hypothetical protein